MKLFDWLKPQHNPDGLGDSIRIGAAAMVKRALYTGTADDGLVISLAGCSLSGERVGDWEITVRRTRAAPVDATPREAEGFEARRAGSAVLSDSEAGARPSPPTPLKGDYK